MSWNVISEMTSGHPCARETLREGVLLSWDPYGSLHMSSVPRYLDICGPFLPHPSLLPLRASCWQVAHMSSLPMTSPELGHHSQVISDTVSFLSQIHFSFVCLKVVQYPAANLAVRETLCLQAFT